MEPVVLVLMFLQVVQIRLAVLVLLALPLSLNSLAPLLQVLIIPHIKFSLLDLVHTSLRQVVLVLKQFWSEAVPEVAVVVQQAAME